MDILDKNEEPAIGKKVEDVLIDGYQFNFGDYLGKGFSLFGKEAGSLIGFTLVYFVILIIGSMIMGLLAIPFADQIFAIIIGSALNAGIYAFMKARKSSMELGFNNFFDGFKPPFWKNLILSALIQSVIAFAMYLVIFIPYLLDNGLDMIMRLSELEQMTDPEELMSFVDSFLSSGILTYAFIAALLGLILSTIWCFAPLFILNRNMGFWEAMEASRKIVMKKLFHFIGFMIVLAIILLIGALICGIGMLVTYPVFCLAIYAAYCHIMEEPSEI